MRLRIAVSAGIAVAVLGLTSCSSVTGQSPKSVEDQAGKMVSDSLGVFTPAVSQTVVSSDWGPCSEDTPGMHRSDYQRVVDFNLAQTDSAKAIGQITAEWRKRGYTMKPQPPGDLRARASGKDEWSLLVGVEPSGTQMFITIDSGCVDVSSDPKTG